MAVNLDERTLDSIENLVLAIKRRMPGVRFVPRENWHITLSFLGYQEDDDILKITRSLRRAVDNFEDQDIKLDEISYGPPGKTPRMIWIGTDRATSENLSRIKKALEEEMLDSGVNFKGEGRNFNGHITLARFMLGREEREGLPPLNEKTQLSFTAEGIDLMESELKRDGAEYTVLQKFPFRN